MGYGTWSWILEVLFLLLILAGVILLVVWVFRQAGGGITQQTSLEILKMRYAKGEITKEEYLETRKDLLGS